MAKEILGHIDCPHCGLAAGMRITLDRSGAPFGYCEGDCSGQMRVGGNASRVAKFYAKHPHLKAPGQAPAEVAPAVVAPPVEPVAEAKPAPAKVATPKKQSLFEQLAGVTA